MQIIKPLKCLTLYGTPYLMQQVDPDVMRPIIEDELKKLSFYSEEDHLDLWKPHKNSLVFQYSPQKDKLAWVTGTIYAQRYRVDSEKNFMEINMLKPDSCGEIFEAIDRIAKKGGIEKIIAHSGGGVDAADAYRLTDLKLRELEFEY